GMVPGDEIAGRLARLRQELAAAALDGAVIVQSADLAYFSGTNQQAHLVVPAAGEPRLLVRRTLARAAAESPLAAVRPLRSLSDLGGELEAAGLPPGSRLGFELDVLPAAAFLGYRRRLAGWALEDCADQLRRTRAVKSAWDVERMRTAA